MDKASGGPIGQAGLLAQIVDGVTETGIGYIMHRPFWREGYATEAALGCRDYAFEKLGKARLVVLVRPENVVSHSVARKLSAVAERETVFAGQPEDCHIEVAQDGVVEHTPVMAND